MNWAEQDSESKLINLTTVTTTDSYKLQWPQKTSRKLKRESRKRAQPNCTVQSHWPLRLELASARGTALLLKLPVWSVGPRCACDPEDTEVHLKLKPQYHLPGLLPKNQRRLQGPQEQRPYSDLHKICVVMDRKGGLTSCSSIRK